MVTLFCGAGKIQTSLREGLLKNIETDRAVYEMRKMETRFEA
jgi:hypothetical protein